MQSSCFNLFSIFQSYFYRGLKRRRTMETLPESATNHCSKMLLKKITFFNVLFLIGPKLPVVQLPSPYFFQHFLKDYVFYWRGVNLISGFCKCLMLISAGSRFFSASPCFLILTFGLLASEAAGIILLLPLRTCWAGGLWCWRVQEPLGAWHLFVDVVGQVPHDTNAVLHGLGEKRRGEVAI